MIYLETEQLKCVSAVAKCGSFTEASYYLSRSQSSISKNILKLEAELGIKIFSRTTRSITLTDAGRELLPLIDEMLSVSSKIEAAARSYSIPAGHHLTVGTIYLGSHNHIESVVAEYSIKHPSVEIEFLESTTSALIPALLAKTVDVAFVSSMYLIHQEVNFQTDPRFISHTVLKDPYYLVTSHGHPLAAKAKIDYGDLKDQVFITTDKKMQVYHDAVFKVLHDHGISPKVALQCSSVRSVLKMVAENAGVAILSSLAIDANDKLAIIPFYTPLIRDTQIIMLNRPKIPVYIQSFYDYLSRNIKMQPPL